VSDQHFTRPEEEEVAQHKAAFLDALKELEAARKYVPQFDTDNNIVMCNKIETLIEWLKKQCN
jgi:hypothetical protein